MKDYLLIPICFVLAFSCKKDPPVVPEPTLSLTAVDASCIEAWLKVTTTQLPATVRLLRDGQRVSDLRLLTSDSLLVDERLLPNRAYTYQLQRLAADSTVTETSESVQVTTMDTTSHNWVFDPPVLLGDGNSSVLYDVAIINDTLAYAVGAIYKRDSLGNWDPNAYNMVKWDGTTWEFMRIQFYTFCGQSGTGSYPAKSIFAFSPTDIWIGMDGSQIVHWSGQNQSAPACTPVSINKLWGDSSTGELWAVGNGGGIGHRSTSGTWRRVESGTNVNLTDIWGGSDESEMWTCGFNETNGGSIVLRLANGEWQVVWDRLAPPRPPFIYTSYLSSLWSTGRGEFLLTGGRFYRNSLLSTNIVRNEYIRTATGYQLFQLGNFAFRVRGSERNNVVLAGDDAMIWHWNGTSWLRFDELTSSDDRLYGLAVSPTGFIAVGTRYSGIHRTALVLRGGR